MLTIHKVLSLKIFKNIYPIHTMWVEVSKHTVFMKIFTQVEHISKWRSTSTCAIGIANINVHFKTLYKIKKTKGSGTNQ